VMLKEVAADVRRDTRNGQRPQQLSDMTKAFYFAKAEQVATTRVDATPAPASGPATISDDRALDMAFWNAAQSSNHCEAVRAYLQRFPRGIFVELAKLSERRLCDEGRKVTVAEPAASAAASSPVSAATLIPAAPSPPPAPPPAAAAAAVPDKVIVAPPSAVPAMVPSAVDLTRTIQLELYRLGCGISEADGKWTVLTREGLRKFMLRTKTRLDTNEPSTAIVTALQKQSGRICPLECGRGTVARGETCVAVAKPKPEPKPSRRVEHNTRSAAPARVRHREPAPAATATAASQPSPGPMMMPMGGMGGMMFFGLGRRRF
jgi:hypothetical protein